MSFWAVVRAEPGHDRLAVASVTLAGFETFAPKTRVQAGAKWRTVPLFSAYFFARVEDHWRAIERALGVAGLVKFGLTPARCPDEEIAKLIARSDPDGVVRLAARPSSQTGRSGLAQGATVPIVDARLRRPLCGHGASDRELVLLNILGAQRPVAIAASLLAAR